MKVKQALLSQSNYASNKDKQSPINQPFIDFILLLTHEEKRERTLA
jgi:hypothetical protein